jgi:hypothetical protein
LSLKIRESSDELLITKIIDKAIYLRVKNIAKIMLENITQLEDNLIQKDKQIKTLKKQIGDDYSLNYFKEVSAEDLAKESK